LESLCFQGRRRNRRVRTGCHIEATHTTAREIHVHWQKQLRVTTFKLVLRVQSLKILHVKLLHQRYPLFSCLRVHVLIHSKLQQKLLNTKWRIHVRGQQLVQLLLPLQKQNKQKKRFLKGQNVKNSVINYSSSFHSKPIRCVYLWNTNEDLFWLNLITFLYSPLTAKQLTRWLWSGCQSFSSDIVWSRPNFLKRFI